MLTVGGSQKNDLKKEFRYNFNFLIMKSIRKQLKPISLFMAFLVLFMSCQQYDDDIVNDSIKTDLVTGKELFKSIFFGYGSISDKISVF